MAIPSAKRRYHLGIRGKLILAIIALGTIPILIGLSVAYYKASNQLREVIGDSFKALATDTALKLDGEMQRLIAGDQFLAQQAVSNIKNVTETTRRIDLPINREKDRQDSILTSWITIPNNKDHGINSGNTVNATVQVDDLSFDEKRQLYVFRISAPIRDQASQNIIGWLHRLYDAERFFNPLIYPIRFGNTGHVMLIDSHGIVISCPLLPTGYEIQDSDLIAQVSGGSEGWITAMNDGHGGQQLSIVGHAPLNGITSHLQNGKSWSMFVWQDSQEIFSPAKSLQTGIALAGLIALGLLTVLGFYASTHIVNPIRTLSRVAANIAQGNLNQDINIRTHDEIEELAEQLNEMRLQLRELIGDLEGKVEERTQELRIAQAERDKVVEHLIQSEKMAAIGTLASGIGHEINNPLYAILGLAEAIRDEQDPERFKEYSQDIVNYSKHISEIVRNLTGYIRPASGHGLETVDVNETLSEALAMAKRSLMSDDIKFIENKQTLPEIQARPEELQQAFFNIIRNGIQAMDGKGVMEINSHMETDQVFVKISDTGPGIPKENLGKIFDPFFTTKDPDEGEGLGLYIVRQTITKNGGAIRVEVEQGKGTVFIINFPRIKALRRNDHVT